MADNAPDPWHTRMAGALAAHPALETLSTFALAASVMAGLALSAAWIWHAPSGPSQSHDCMVEAVVAFGALLGSVGLSRWYVTELRPLAWRMRDARGTAAGVPPEPAA